MTLWQRFWSSPWMWLAATFLFGYYASTTRGWQEWVNIGFMIGCWVQVFHYGDLRWGKRIK